MRQKIRFGRHTGELCEVEEGTRQFSMIISLLTLELTKKGGEPQMSSGTPGLKSDQGEETCCEDDGVSHKDPECAQKELGR